MQETMCPFCMNTVQTDICPHCGGDVHYPGYPGHLPVGYTLQGRDVYILGAYIGQGGFGITYIALDMATNQRVAIKEYYPNHCCLRNNSTCVYPSAGQEETYSKGKQHFLMEAQMLQSLSDLDSVVKVLDYFEANNSAYLVMEYLDGLSLKDHVEKNGKMPAQPFLNQLKLLMADMEMMHRRGVVHRDIAPDNIILLPDGRLKLIDFGAARSYVGDKSMTVVVKKGFAPVEQYMRKGSNASTDVYALAATIYYCITGIIPPDSAERQYGEAQLQAPTALGVELSREQERGLEKALEIQPKERIQSVAELAKELEHLPKSMLQKQEEERRQQEKLRKKQEEERRRQEMLLKKQEEERRRQEKLLKKQEEERLRQEKLRQKREEEHRRRAKQKEKQALHSEESVKTSSEKSGKRYVFLAAALAVVLTGVLLIHRFIPKGDASLSIQETGAPVAETEVPAETRPVQELSAEARQYNEAVDFFENKEYGKAAIAFGKLGDYRDAKQISSKIWDALTPDKTIATGAYHTVAVKNDGTVLAAGKNYDDGCAVISPNGQCDIKKWTDIISIAAGDYHTVGLRKDGTVLATGKNHQGQCDVSHWTDIIDITAGEKYTVGLKSDGTVIYAGDIPTNHMEKWEDIVSISGGRDSVIGLKSDGTALLSGGIVLSKTNLIGVASRNMDRLILSADGVFSVSSKSTAIGEDIVSIFAGGNIAVGIKRDGTVITDGGFLEDTKPANLDNWEDLKGNDIAAFDASLRHAVILKNDGTASAYGDNLGGRCNVKSWKDIRLPADRDALLATIELEHITSEDTHETMPSGLSPEATAYNEAVRFFKNEEYGKAAIAFGKLGDYRDAREISSRIWSAITDQDIIHAGYGYAVAVRDDGTVMTAGEAKFDDSKVHGWKDIVAVEPVMGELAGLKSDGSVVGTGSWIENNFDLWNNLVSIQGEHGLCSDGTFVTSVQQIRECYSWLFDAEDIISFQCANFASGDGAILKADGTVEGWKVSSDGKSLVPIEEVSEWKDIVSIEYSSAGNLFGISADGKVYSARTSRAAGTFLTDDWKDIVSITNCGSHVIGLKSDGTVVAAGQTEGEHFDEEGWADIAAIYQTAGHTIGLKTDGTVVTTGIEDAVTKGMKEWANIKIPVRRDDLPTAIQLDYISDEDAFSLPESATEPESVTYTMAAMSTLQGDKLITEDDPFWGGTVYPRRDIISVTFRYPLVDVPEDAWDVSETQDRSILAWVTDGNLTVASDGYIALNPDSASMFYNFTNLTGIDFGDHTDTTQVTNMSRMFMNCYSLQTLDLSNFNTEKVADMSDMFSSCMELENLDISSFDTANVTTMEKMFHICNSIQTLDLRHFNTENVTTMHGMFWECFHLKDLDISSFDTSSVTTMSSMFRNCSELTRLDLSNFDTSKVTSMAYMFAHCRGLMYVDLSSFDTSVVTRMNHMFEVCDALLSLDLRNFDVSNVTDMTRMFYWCSELSEIEGVYKLKVHWSTETYQAFYECPIRAPDWA